MAADFSSEHNKGDQDQGVASKDPLIRGPGGKLWKNSILKISKGEFGLIKVKVKAT